MKPTHEQLKAFAKQKGVGRLLTGRELRKLPELLGEHEDVVSLAQGNYDGHFGILAVTDDRVIFLDQTAFTSRMEDFPFGRISSVQTKTGFASGELVIFTSGNKAVIKQVVPRERVEEIGDLVRQRIAAPSSPPTPATPAGLPDAPAPSDPLERLRKLGELHDAGVVTDEEFESKKAALLRDV